MQCRLVASFFLLQLAAAVAGQTAATAPATRPATAGGAGTQIQKSPALTGVRRPLYRLRKSDALEIRFSFSPEFDQNVTIQPDGFIPLKAAGEVHAEGLTIAELRDALSRAYEPVLRDPEISVFLREFEKPFFLAGGQVTHPGKYELRSPTTATEAIAIAGGFTDQAKHSQVVVFRKVLDQVVETHVLDIKTMLASRNLEEDMELQPGDMLFVPQNRISKIRKFLPVSTLSTYFSPAQF